MLLAFQASLANVLYIGTAVTCALLYEVCDIPRGRKPCPPTITSVLTTTRKGIGVSLRRCPVAAMMSAAHVPIPKGRSSAQGLLVSTPAMSAIARIRMMVIREECHQLSGVSSPRQLESS